MHMVSFPYTLHFGTWFSEVALNLGIPLLSLLKTHLIVHMQLKNPNLLQRAGSLPFISPVSSAVSHMKDESFPSDLALERWNLYL